MAEKKTTVKVTAQELNDLLQKTYLPGNKLTLIKYSKKTGMTLIGE